MPVLVFELTLIFCDKCYNNGDWERHYMLTDHNLDPEDFKEECSLQKYTCMHCREKFRGNI